MCKGMYMVGREVVAGGDIYLAQNMEGLLTTDIKDALHRLS